VKLNPRYFYESFEDLDALLVAVFDRIAAEALEAVLQALESAPDDALGRSRAVIAAFVDLMTADPRKGRVAFIEAMGSEALMRRRLDVLQQFAELTAHQGREFLGSETIDQRSAELTAQILMGGLAEVVIAWLEGRLDVTRDRLVEHCAAIFAATAGVSSA
jgi:AcrR family transcriptional regulator